MPTLFLVRHAKPAANWGDSKDAELDEVGVQQAQSTAASLAKRTAAVPILTSPMLRCRQTALPLEAIWNSAATVFPAVAELPAPPLPMNERRDWLVNAMAGTWQSLHSSAPTGSPDFLSWRADLLGAVLRIPEDAVIFSHYIAINAIVGAAHSSDRVVSFRPDHASVTIVTTDANKFSIVELGREAATAVLTR